MHFKRQALVSDLIYQSGMVTIGVLTPFPIPTEKKKIRPAEAWITLGAPRHLAACNSERGTQRLGKV